MRSYSVGENIYGYLTKPSGKLKVNKNRQYKYDGMIHVINPDEAEVVAEDKVEALKKENELLSYQKQNKYISPPREWFRHRLDKLRDILNKNTTSSSKALKELLGTISMEPVTR
jgi:hypothetical protein